MLLILYYAFLIIANNNDCYRSKLYNSPYETTIAGQLNSILLLLLFVLSSFLISYWLQNNQNYLYRVVSLRRLLFFIAMDMC